MKMHRRHLLLGSAALLGVAALGWPSPEKTFGTAIIAPAQAQSVDKLMTAGPMGDKMIGQEDAPVTIIEYASLTCGHCADFHTDSLPAIKEKYIETGKAKLIFREFPFDARAYAGFMLARCAEDEFYFPMIDVLFQQQNSWVPAEDPRGPLLQIAKLAGFTQESFEACLQNQEVLDSVNAVRKHAAEQLGVDSTPTFFINGDKHTGNLSVEAMSKIIDSHL